IGAPVALVAGLNYSIQFNPRFWADDTIGDQAMSTLESAYRSFCFRTEDAVCSKPDFCLNLLNQFTHRATPESWPAGGSTWRGSRFGRRDERKWRGSPVYDCSHR